MKNSRKNSKLRNVAVASATLVVVVGFALVFTYSISKKNAQPLPEDSNTMDLSPATEKDQQIADQKKEKLLEQQKNQSNSNQSSDGLRKVTPIISVLAQDNGIIKLRAFIPEIYESTGTCTAIFVQGNQNIERTVQGIKDATTTRCDVINVPSTEFNSKGSWTVSISYQSPTSKGQSNSSSLEVK